MKSVYTQIIAVASLATISPLLAADWTGTTDQDWNTGTNWSGGVVPSGENAFINVSTGNFPVISADTTATPNDNVVGNGGNTGRLDHRAGTHSGGGGNWTKIGDGAGSTGTYNLADTSSSGAGISGFAQGSGSFNSGNRLMVGLGGGTGFMNVNTTGTISTNQTGIIGENGPGTVNFESGTWTCNDEFWVGNNDGGTGGDGTLNMDGGTITSGQWFVVGRFGSTGVMNLSGGTIKPANTNNDANLVVGTNDAAGTGSGTVNQTGGTMDTIGDNGGGGIFLGENDNSTGTYIQDAGVLQTNLFSVGRNGNVTATYTLNSGTALVQGGMILGQFDTANGTVNLNGGTLTTSGITQGTGSGTLNLNGSTIVATQDNTTFIDGVFVDLQAGGITIDSAGFNVTATSDLGGAGGLTKNGAGTLTLSGDPTYAGNNTVNGGTLGFTTDTNAGLLPTDVTLADNTGLAVTTAFIDDQVSIANVTFSGPTGGTLDINLGNAMGSNPTTAPLDVSTLLGLNGTVTVNVTGDQLAVGTIPLVGYVSKTGSGTLVLGTLPLGVQATLTDSGSQVALNVTSVALPRWIGGVDSEWDTTTLNWEDQVTFNASTYADGDPVLFDDVSANPAVNLDVTVMPASVTFDSLVNDYTLNGTGKLSGSTGILKKDSGMLTIGSMSNDYTGVTRVEGGTLSIGTITNGGVAGPIGAATSDPANLVIAGGKLEYTGASVTTDRGFTVGAVDSEISAANDVTVTGLVDSTNGAALIKRGTGTLTFSNAGPNFIGKGGADVDVADIRDGVVTLNGGGTQVMNFDGNALVGRVDGNAATLNVDNATLNVSGWLNVNRNNGSTGVTSTINVVDSTVNHTGGGMATGFSDDPGTNNVSSVIQVTDSVWNHSGATILSESDGSTTTMTLSGATTYSAGDRINVGVGAGVGTIVIENGSSMSKNTNGWIAIGQNSTSQGTMTIRDTGSFTSAGGDFNVGDADDSVGTINVEDSATLDITGNAHFGKNNNATGNLNLSGGTATFNNELNLGNNDASNAVATLNGGDLVANGSVWIGRNLTATGTVTQSAGSATYANFVYVGFGDGTTGTYSLSGGSLNQTNTGERLIVGDQGTGTLTVSATGVVNADGPEISVAPAATGNGTIDLNTGGTINAKAIRGAAGTSVVNFNGGAWNCTEASVTAGDILGVDTANLAGGGLNIDTSGFDVTTGQTFSGVGGFDKTGLGTLTLTGSSGASGTSTISAGTVVTTSSNFFGNASTVNLVTGATLDLSFVGDDYVTEFELDGVAQGAGTYNSGNTTGIIGAGNLVVGTPPPYLAWAGSFAGLSNTDPAVDFDKGGLDTGIEWVVDGDPTDPADDAANAPTVSTDGTFLVFNYRRNDDANNDGNTIIDVEYGTDAQNWTLAQNGVDGVVITPFNDDIAPGIDRVEVKIPLSLASPGNVLVARLNVLVTP